MDDSDDQVVLEPERVLTEQKLVGNWFTIDDISGVQQIESFNGNGSWSTVTSMVGEDEGDRLIGSWSPAFNYTDTMIQITVSFDPALSGSIDTFMEYIIEFVSDDHFLLYTTHFDPDSRQFITESEPFYRIK